MELFCLQKEREGKNILATDCYPILVIFLLKNDFLPLLTSCVCKLKPMIKWNAPNHVNHSEDTVFSCCEHGSSCYFMFLKDLTAIVK